MWHKESIRRLQMLYNRCEMVTTQVLEKWTICHVTRVRGIYFFEEKLRAELKLTKNCIHHISETISIAISTYLAIIYIYQPRKENVSKDRMLFDICISNFATVSCKTH